MGTLVGIGYLMTRLRLSRTRCYQLTQKPGFPQPAGHVVGRVWEQEDLDDWIARDGRTPEPARHAGGSASPASGTAPRAQPGTHPLTWQHRENHTPSRR
jgi:hypothetical protein